MAGAAGQGELVELAERLVEVVGAPSGIGGLQPLPSGKPPPSVSRRCR